VRKFVDSRPLEENRLIAFSILQPVIWGAKDEPVGKAAESETMEATDSPTTKSPSQPSMELVQQ
jgi:hypothetical protein